MSRQVVLDTETTGLEPAEGHRVIEIGCVELIDRRLTGREFHVYLNPDREIDAEAVAVHGISNERLVGEPRFAEVVEAFLDFVRDSELVIHNAPFDIGFLNHELSQLDSRYGVMEDYCSILDTLVLARRKRPGQRNSLDVLCREYGVDNSHRIKHGALLDAEILADVYLRMTGGQTRMALAEPGAEDSGAETASGDFGFRRVDGPRPALQVIAANDSERSAHQQRLAGLEKQSGSCIWHQIEAGEPHPEG